MKSGLDRIGRTVSVSAAKRTCLDKRRFESKNEARDSAAKYLTREPTWKPMRPYRCTLCGGYHLTSSTPAAGGKILTTRRMP